MSVSGGTAIGEIRREDEPDHKQIARELADLPTMNASGAGIQPPVPEAATTSAPRMTSASGGG
jgi:hypothetical protein